MKTCYFVQTEYTQAFFTEEGVEICHWHCNDASWRPEYMAALVHWAGAEVVEATREQRALWLTPDRCAIWGEYD